jgi:two-component system, NtrC family, response regulator PilR
MNTHATKKPHALIVDDEPDIRELLAITLGRMGIATTIAKDIASAEKALHRHQFDICLTDMKLPDGNGITLVEYIQKNSPELPVAVITAFGSMELAITALKAGAFDFISKPIELETLRNTVQTALNLAAPNPEQRGGTTRTDDNTLLLGQCAQMQQLHEQIAKVARSQAPVYIHGESGSGKELVARAIHNQSGRAKARFVAVNCGAIPRELMESEFFGHKKGSFTGATADKAGLFQAAHNGTLFLDEVADLPLDMQVKLLRAIQEKHVRPIGAENEIPIDVRILSATHKNLQQEVIDGKFRQDLFFRINVIQTNVPSLRERRDDIPLLIQHFLRKFNKDKTSIITLDEDAKQALQSYAFPGNVRELENILERACTLCENHRIQIADLNLPALHTPSTPALQNPSQALFSTTTPGKEQASPGLPVNDVFLPKPFPPPVFQTFDQYIEDIERAVLEQALAETRWNKTATAQRLGISFRQLRYKLKKLGLD